MAIGTRALVGREEELSSLFALLDEPGAKAVVAGDPGIGKTTLWLAVVEEARARGYVVLSCRPSESEARYSFSGLGDLLGGLMPGVLPELPRPQRRALETALALSDTDGRVEERLVAFALLGAVRRLAAAGPVLLAVDDLQWLDGPSSGLLQYVLPRLANEPVAAVVTVRGPVPAWLTRLEGLRELELSPLSVGALHELLRTRLEASFPRPVLLRIWETSGGNPFFALELARALQRRGGRIEPGAELPVPATLEDLVLERLQTLSPEAEDVCRVVAAAAEPTVVARQEDDERAADFISDSFGLKQAMHVKEVTWVLPIQRGTEFSTVEFRQRQRLHGGRSSKYLDSPRNKNALRRRIHRTSQDDVGFDFYFADIRHTDHQLDHTVLGGEFPFRDMGRRH